jgi:hypothetical protein
MIRRFAAIIPSSVFSTGQMKRSSNSLLTAHLIVGFNGLSGG